MFNDIYNHSTGTHCWFCNRAYGEPSLLYDKRLLVRTREHIIPISHIKKINKSQREGKFAQNYIGSCNDCNAVKRTDNAKQFAERLGEYILEGKQHPMAHLFPLMRNRSWKAYNKTSKLHKLSITLRRLRS
jgi:hypothetical protein